MKRKLYVIALAVLLLLSGCGGGGGAAMEAFEQALAGSLPVTAVWEIQMEDISAKAKLEA